jgi:4-hydroxyphenylpyruvate dioxygenase
MLATLGFSEVGRHKTKPVTRWQQGTINIVINRDGEGFAHAHDMVHGASVCAIGLRVRDVPGALKRARALQVPLFSQPTAPGDAELAAVRGIGGSLLYFVEEGTTEDLWRGEFVPIAGVPAAAAGLARFDHLAQVMQYDEMFSWLLFYVALLDVEKKPMVEFADPLGLVQSQAIETGDRSLRMTLNASAASETLSARFLRAYTGAGVQYAAFQTDDVFRSADASRASGIELLGIPSNYYDDLGARFDLPEEMLRRMRGASILYDRDETGEYLHYYCRAFAKRFFFEIVERRNYDGYGIANEPVRLASQARFKTAPAA